MINLAADTFVDAAGNRHGCAGPDARIACLVPSITELVCELGLIDQLVARTGFCVHPRPAIDAIPKVGGTKDVHLDRLRDLAPTHVIVNIDENEKPMAERIAGFVPNMIVTHPKGPADNLALYCLIGGIFGRAAQAQVWCARFESALQAAHRECAAFARRRVLYLIWKDPWMTVSRDTYVARTLAVAGWDTVPALAAVRYPAIDLDAAVREADLVLLSTEPYRFDQAHASTLAKRWPDKQVALIDGEMTSWYGTRAVEGLHYLARLRRELDVGWQMLSARRGGAAL